MKKTPAMRRILPPSVIFDPLPGARPLEVPQAVCQVARFLRVRLDTVAGDGIMSIHGRLSRRRFLRGTGAAAFGAAAIACPCLVFAQNKKAIKFTLPWVAERSNLFTLAASQAIGEGRFDFGMSTPSIAILQTIRGLPTVALAACAYDATMGIGVLNDGPIKAPKDLKGRKMASVATSGDYPFLPLFAEKAGFDLAKVTRIQVDNKVRDRLLPE